MGVSNVRGFRCAYATFTELLLLCVMQTEHTPVLSFQWHGAMVFV